MPATSKKIKPSNTFYLFRASNSNKYKLGISTDARKKYCSLLASDIHTYYRWVAKADTNLPFDKIIKRLKERLVFCNLSSEDTGKVIWLPYASESELIAELRSILRR